jgi:hypothetical protein
MHDDLILYKSLDKQEHAENLANGILLLRSVNYYRLMVDPNEFTITKKGRIISLANDALVFCCHEHFPNNDKQVVKINRPCDLFTYISCIIKPSVISPGNYFGKVKYENMSISDPSDFDIKRIHFYCPEVYSDDFHQSNIDAPSIECAFYKDKTKFKNENEVRMCFLIDKEKLSNMEGNDFKVFFRKSEICDHCFKWSHAPYDYDTWKILNAHPNYREYCWFEVWLKVDKVHFTLI